MEHAWKVFIEANGRQIERVGLFGSTDRRSLRRAILGLSVEEMRELGVGVGDSVKVRGWPMNEVGEPLRGVEEIEVGLEGFIAVRAAK